jgi:hypothetical protein
MNMPCKTFIPGEWLKLHNSVGQCKPSLGTGFDSVTKKLFHTPSPKSTLGQSSKYALIYRPYNLSKSKSRLTGFESVSKKTKHSERVIPKVKNLLCSQNFQIMVNMVDDSNIIFQIKGCKVTFLSTS